MQHEVFDSFTYNEDRFDAGIEIKLDYEGARLFVC